MERKRDKITSEAQYGTELKFIGTVFKTSFNLRNEYFIEKINSYF